MPARHETKKGVITAVLRRQRHEISLSSPNEPDEMEDVLVEENLMAKHKAYELTGSKKWPCRICGRKIVNHFWAKRQHLERCQNRHRAPCGECGKKIASNKNAWWQHWQHCPGRRPADLGTELLIICRPRRSIEGQNKMQCLPKPKTLGWKCASASICSATAAHVSRKAMLQHARAFPFGIPKY